jgi:hypothetical protein
MLYIYIYIYIKKKKKKKLSKNLSYDFMKKKRLYKSEK